MELTKTQTKCVYQQHGLAAL